MNCKECQTYILSDYLDGELDELGQKDMDVHLESCPKCKEFLLITKRSIIEPFEKAEHVSVSEDKIWENIKQDIDGDEIPDRRSWFEGIRNILFPQPTFALATLTCLIVIFSIFTLRNREIMMVKEHKSQIQKIVKKDMEKTLNGTESPIEYMAYLLDEDDNVDGYGTMIEDFFL